MINTTGQSEQGEKKIYGMPTNDVEAMILTNMTRDRNKRIFMDYNAYFHGNFVTTNNMPNNPVIVDIGSGEGECIEDMYNYLDFLHPKTYGIDIYLPQRKELHTNFIYQDLKNGLFLPESADRIYSRHTLQYLSNAREIAQDAYNQTNAYKKESKEKAIGMFHFGPVYFNEKGEKIKPISYDLEQSLKTRNKACNVRFLYVHPKYEGNNIVEAGGQFLVYEKTDANTELRIPDNIIAEKGNMYHPNIRNSEKFYNFTLPKN